MVSPTIAVVDDDPDTLEFVGILLAMYGYEIILLSEARSAFEKLKFQEPALVILDLNMQGDPQAGCKILHLIREDVAMAHIRVVLYSAELYRLHKCMKSGTAQPDAMLEKPFEPATLIRKVEELLP